MMCIDLIKINFSKFSKIFSLDFDDDGPKKQSRQLRFSHKHRIDINELKLDLLKKPTLFSLKHSIQFVFGA